MLAESQATTTWHDYVELEMTVIPIPHGQKHPVFRWKRLQWTKLHVLYQGKYHNYLPALYGLGGDGLAVVCGRPSENLFAIDCDTPQALAQVKQQLALRGIQAPCVLSSRGGHIYLRARDGAVKGIASGIMQDMEIKGDGELAVLPPTIHHTGIRYRWEKGTPYNIPTISTDDIDFLTDIDGNSLQLKTTGNSQRRLHDDTRHYLKYGSRLPGGNRNNALFNAARDYAYVGKSRHDAHYDLIRIARTSGLSDNEASATIDSAFNGRGVLQRTRSTTSNSVTDDLHAFLENATWQPRTGNTDKRVFAALIQRRKQDTYTRNNGEFRASYRELMKIAHIKGWRTIKRSIQRLKAAGYIQKCSGDKASGASIYRFSEMVIAAGTYYAVQEVHTKTAGAVRSTYCLTYAHPLAKQIGITATSILNHLHASGGASAKQIVSAIGKHRSTITRQLAKLISHNLVCKCDDTYQAIEINITDEIDILRDTGAYADQQQLTERHDRERALFALHPILSHLFHKNSKKQEAL